MAIHSITTCPQPMETPEMIRQRAYRARRTAKLAAMEQALREIVLTLQGNNKPLAGRLRVIAERGLNKSEAA